MEHDKKKEVAKQSLLMKLKALLTKKNPNRKKMEKAGYKVNKLEPRN